MAERDGKVTVIDLAGEVESWDRLFEAAQKVHHIERDLGPSPFEAFGNQSYDDELAAENKAREQVRREAGMSPLDVLGGGD